MWNKIKDALRYLKDKAYINVLLMIAKLVFGDRWKGAKTLVAGILVFILGLWNWIDGSGIYGLLCQYSESLCNIQETTFYGWVLMAIGVIQQLLRVVTDSPVGPAATAK